MQIYFFLCFPSLFFFLIFPLSFPCLLRVLDGFIRSPYYEISMRLLCDYYVILRTSLYLANATIFIKALLGISMLV